MKIAFTGKGGSGKTTMSSLFAQVAADDGYKVLALDADINQHLAAAVGYVGALRSMGADVDMIKEYLRGSSRVVGSVATMHKSTPPGKGSRLLRLTADDWFINQFTVNHQGVWIAGAGEIPEGNVGVRCYHGLNGAIELVLGHTIDNQEDIVLVDMTAGADAFSSTLFTKVDTLVLVVEPTLKSLGVYAQFKQYADAYAVPVVVIGNKIENDEDKGFVLQFVPEVAIWVAPSRYIKYRERGVADEVIEPETIDALRRLREKLVARPIDWEKREQLSHRMHRRAVDEPMIDPDFSLVKAAL